MWQNWLNAILGLVIIGVALFAGLGLALAWTLGILGAAVAVLGLWGAGELSGAVGQTKHA